ncbi:hypothetical protein H9L13_05015 [Sphingomonas lutea]|uniref:Uncharacterized protein n=1 Tax=Sphingomonas lutea TaxID=1045317 RepID=A0A7G9SK63_9SPHN|nr:hypothetical protein [Sphingomonas lutea]QNN68238.1 hypothetical protein H9L13_05015 [Sphingomonas lutea]
MVGVALTACEFLPGSKEYRAERAKRAVAKLLLDPSSAQFRNVQVRGQYVCGEINGKNRMGGFVGFTRFVVQLDGQEAQLDPEFNFADLLSAEDSCRALTGNEYASISTQLSACNGAEEQRGTAALQTLFDQHWSKRCEFASRSSVYRPPLADSGAIDEQPAANVSVGHNIDGTLDNSATVLVDEEGMPVRPQPDRELQQRPAPSETDPSSQSLDQVLPPQQQPGEETSSDKPEPN